MKLWIARDKDSDELYLYKHKPLLDGGQYKPNLSKDGWVCLELPSSWFPELTFGNSPQEVELKLVSEIVGIAESPSKTFPRVNEFETGASYRR